MRVSLLKNFASMFLWQGMNYVLPLITLPYLARTLAPYQYGVLGFTTGVTAYFVLLTNWGFSLSATQRVAAHRDDPQALTSIFWNTLFAKAALGALSLVLLAAVIMATPSLRQYAPILLLSWSSVFGNMLTADFFLIGMELMSRFATASVVGRMIPIPFMFLLVHGPGDVAWAALLQGLGSVGAAAVSLYLSYWTGRIGRMTVSPRQMWHSLRDGGELFLSQAAVSLYSNLNALVLAGVAGPVQVGLFVGADKLRNAVQGLISPVSIVMYPRLANMFASDPARMFASIRKLALFQGVFTGLLSIGTFLFAPLAVRILLGEQYMDAVHVLRALAPVPFLVGLNNVLGVQIMIPLGWRREFLIMIAAPAVFSLTYMPLLAWHYGAFGVAGSLTLTELMVNLTAFVLLYVRRAELRAYADSKQSFFEKKDQKTFIT